MAVAFDTLDYAKELQSAGFTPQQAEVQAKALARIVDERLATKQDIELLKHELQRDIKELEERLTYRLTLRMGAMLAAAVGVIAALIRIL